MTELLCTICIVIGVAVVMHANLLDFVVCGSVAWVIVRLMIWWGDRIPPQVKFDGTTWRIEEEK